MKKALSLILALVLCLSLCACGGGNDTPETTEAPTETTTSENTMLSKEELDALAVPFTEDDIRNTVNNYALASSFIGNVYSFDGIVRFVSNDYVSLEVYIDDSLENMSLQNATVYLAPEVLAELQYGQRVRVIGKISSLSNGIESQNAYIDPYYEIEGTLNGYNASMGGWNFFVEGSSYSKTVYFADGVDLSQYDESYTATGNEVTISTKIIDGKYTDAIIVE